MGNTHSQADITRLVDEVIRSRRSVRGFLPTPVPQETILEILDVATRAPSGTNTQPWKVTVVTGAKKEALSRELIETALDPARDTEHGQEYSYYPDKWVHPYLDRRRKVGYDLYGLLGIAKGNRDRMRRQFARNYDFFGAPVGLFFTMDRIMGQGSWLDYGMFLQNVMLAARARGLDTCPQAAFTKYHRIVASHLEIPKDQILLCGMALGYKDSDKIENSLQTSREPAISFTRFLE
ncbi:MAG: nitroreductase [Verrucomicrobia bacterium]|nr:nitroreductase [Verrucomicrobiota bacterium]